MTNVTLNMCNQQNLGDGTPDVREGSYQSIAAFVYKMTENKVAPFLGDIDKIKMDKVCLFNVL